MRATPKTDVQRWLQQHCESAGNVAGGLVISTGHGSAQAQHLAEWPATGGMTAPLAAAAEAAAQRARPVLVSPTVAPPDATHNRVISLPLRSGERTLGAVALAVQAKDGEEVSAMFKELELACADIGASLDAPLAGEAATADVARVLQLQDSLLRRPTLAEGALALLTELAPLLGCDGAALGALEGDGVTLLALSNSAQIRGEQDLLRAMSAAMQEAMDQGARIVYPASPTATARIVLAHAELHGRSGQALVSVPLVHAGQAIGALQAQWPAAAPPRPGQLALLDSVAGMLGPVLALSQRAERGWLQRTQDALRTAAARLTRRDDPLPKLAAFGVLAALVAASAWPMTYRIGAPARIEGAVQRVVAAPQDGFLHQSHVRPGDMVHAGDLLVELADQDLQLEQRRWESALTQHENGYAAALAHADRAQFVVALGKAGEARAQLDLVRQQLARTRLVAPIDGVVIKGDLSQALGAPVQRGDALLTLAPAERYRLVIDVDERDVASVRKGQTGQLALASTPGDTLGFVVERVTPVATAREGRNAFEVEARLDAAAPLLRPGLQGVAKIEAGERAPAWIWGHRALDWLRLAWWSWGP